VKLSRWKEFPPGIQAHLSERLDDRSISLADLKKLQFWVASNPEVPEYDWYKDFGSFKICGRGAYPKTFLRRDQKPWGEPI
jgi:hypothetical protein